MMVLRDPYIYIYIHIVMRIDGSSMARGHKKFGGDLQLGKGDTRC